MSNGSIDRRPNGKWRARYRDETRKERAQHFDRKVDAQRWLAEIMAARLTGQYVDPKAGNITFKEYAEAWRKIQVHSQGTAEALERHFRLHVYPAIGSMPLRTITPTHLQAMVSGFSVAPATTEVIWRYVGTVFKAAVRDRRIALTPCAGVNLPPKPITQIDVIPTELVLAIHAAIPERYKAMIPLAAGTGLRQGEVFGLPKHAIRLDSQEIRVEQQVQRFKGEKPKLVRLKTNASYRTLPLPKVVAAALSAHLLQFPPTREDQLLFTNLNNGMLYRSGFNQVFQRAVREATGGVKLDRKIGFHSLRHYYASLLISHGESVTVVQHRLGHKTPEETLQTYSHLWPDSGDRTRTVIDNVLGSRADSLRTVNK